MKAKCEKKLNFIKVLRSKKWDAKTNTKIQVYNTLIRSISDYAATLFQNISGNARHKIETIQYNSMLHILKESPGTSHTDMRKKLDIDTLENRHKQLKEKYIQKALKNNQLLIDLYNEHQQFNKDHSITDPKYLMFNMQIAN